MKKVLVLGCTGSIGTNTLNIIRSMPEEFCICGLTAHSNKKSLDFLSNEFNCKGLIVSQSNVNDIAALIDETKPDVVINGIAGSAGLLPSKIVCESGVNLALANKETVVMAWDLIKETAFQHDCTIIPVDSEHSAIFSLINQCGKENVDSILITASGGPFRTYSHQELENVTVEQALNHPTWKMGKKITVDSASLANKGLEVIEACRLFDIPANKVSVVIHPQSLVHSLVRTNDGMLYAQISDPDMKHPIINALNYPKNLANELSKFDLFDLNMTFFKPRINEFPMLGYAFEAAKAGKSYTIAYNAANEIAVNAFLEKKISFTAISRVVRAVLDKDWSVVPSTYDEVFEQDKKSRAYAREQLI